jgi:hypothetical protein
MFNDPRLAERIYELRAYCKQNNLPDDEVAVIVFNSAFNSPDSLEIPPELLAYLKRNGLAYDIIICDSLLTLPLNFVAIDSQKKDFQRGKPILFSAKAYLTIDKRTRGGQELGMIEVHIRSVLENVIYSITEQLFECEKTREGRKKLTAEVRRENVVKYLADKLIESYSDVSSESKDCISLLTTFHSDASKIGPNAYYNTEDLEAAIEGLASDFLNLSKVEQQGKIDFEILQIISLLRCKKRAKQLRLARGDEAKAVSKGEAVSPSKLIEIAGTRDDIHLDVLDLLPAAFAGDFIPMEIFQVHGGNSGHFEILQKLGRLARGRKSVNFTINEFQILDDMLDIVERYRQPSWEGDTNQTKEAAFWHKALTASMPLPLWYKQLHAPSNQKYLNLN